MLVAADAPFIAFGIVEPTDFYREAHRLIFAAMKSAADAGKPVDLITVATNLRSAGQLEEVGGGEYLTALMNEVPTAAHIAAYASTVREKAVLRGLIEYGAEVQRKASENPDNVHALLSDTVTGALRHADQSKQLSAAPVAEHLKRHGPRLQAAIEQPFAITPARYGIADLDKATGGMGGMYLITVTAQEKAGKSTFAVHAAMSSANRFLLQPEAEREYVLVFSIEEGPYSWLRLASAWLAQVNSLRLLPGRCRADEKKELLAKMAEAQDGLSVYPIILGEGAETTDAIVTAIRVEAQRHKLGLIVVDYLQRLATNEQYQSMMDAARGLQRSEAAQTPLLLMSQMSYDQVKGEPLPYGGKGAAQDCSLWLGIDRDRDEDKTKRDTGRVICHAARSINEFAPIPIRIDFSGGSHIYSVDAERDNKYGKRLGDDKPHEPAEQLF